MNIYKNIYEVILFKEVARIWNIFDSQNILTTVNEVGNKYLDENT